MLETERSSPLGRSFQDSLKLRDLRLGSVREADTKNRGHKKRIRSVKTGKRAGGRSGPGVVGGRGRRENHARRVMRGCGTLRTNQRREFAWGRRTLPGLFSRGNAVISRSCYFSDALPLQRQAIVGPGDEVRRGPAQIDGDCSAKLPILRLPATVRETDQSLRLGKVGFRRRVAVSLRLGGCRMTTSAGQMRSSKV